MSIENTDPTKKNSGSDYLLIRGTPHQILGDFLDALDKQNGMEDEGIFKPVNITNQDTDYSKGGESE